MSENEQAVDYIDNRLIKRTEFFERRKREAIIFLIIFQVAIIVFSSTIPVINTVQFPDPSLVRITSALLGAVIAALTGIIQFGKFQERWIIFKLTSRMLEKEHHLYKHDAGVYEEIKDVKDKERLLVERVEDILEKEATEYIAVFEDNKRRNDGRQTPSNDNVGRTA